MLTFLLLPIVFVSMALSAVTAMLMLVSVLMSLFMGAIVTGLIMYATAFLGMLMLLFS